jgi:Fe-Mn family superoxide dismutase
MELHHSKHHNAYVTNFNAALDQLETAVHKKDVNAILALQPAIKFNGGGHLNHALFWENLAPPSATGKIGPKLQAAIDASFGGFDEMKKELSTKSVGVQGSGWGWLTYNPGTGESLQMKCTPLLL